MPCPAAEGPLQTAAPAIGGILAGVLCLLTGWGFTVDDALISARVAHHLSTGHGYVFNAAGPVVDCVTPLGWSPLLAVLPGNGPLETLHSARLLSAGGWLVASGILGHCVGQATRGWRRLAILLLIAGFLPFGAWASSGMETGLVLALSTAAVAPVRFASLYGGLAAALRPELTPWAVVLASGRAGFTGATARRKLLETLLALSPSLIVFGLRFWSFGRLAPLSVFAKPSTAAAGMAYIWGAFILSGPLWLLASRRLFRTSTSETVPIVAALFVHGFVLIGVGGDWMPLWRLAVPVLPGAFVVGAHLAQHRPTLQTLSRILLCGTLCGLWHWKLGTSTRGVSAQRNRLIEGARHLLQTSATLATLDVGWVGAVGSHHIFDLAGLTDERIAMLPGGHTSKRLPRDFLEARQPDALVLLLRDSQDWHNILQISLADAAQLRPFARQVENRLASMPGANQFFPVKTLPFGRQAYVLYEALLSP